MTNLKPLKRGFSLENLKPTYVSCFYRYLMATIAWSGAVDCSCNMTTRWFIFGTNYKKSLHKCFGLWKHFSSDCKGKSRLFQLKYKIAESYYFDSIAFIIPTKHLKRVNQKGVCGSFNWQGNKLKTHCRLSIFGLNYFQKLHASNLTLTLGVFRFTEN